MPGWGGGGGGKMTKGGGWIIGLRGGGVREG